MNIFYRHTLIAGDVDVHLRNHLAGYLKSFPRWELGFEDTAIGAPVTYDAIVGKELGQVSVTFWLYPNNGYSGNTDYQRRTIKASLYYVLVLAIHPFQVTGVEGDRIAADNQAVIRLRPLNEKAQALAFSNESYYDWGGEDLPSSEIKAEYLSALKGTETFEGIEVEWSVVNTPTILSLWSIFQNRADEGPPVSTHDETTYLHLQLRSDAVLAKSCVDRLAHAVCTSLYLDARLAVRPEIKPEWEPRFPDVAGEYLTKPSVKVEAALRSSWQAEANTLYLAAVLSRTTIGPCDLAFLAFYKVLEYVAALASDLRVAKNLSNPASHRMTHLRKIIQKEGSDKDKLHALLKQLPHFAAISKLCPVKTASLSDVFADTRNALVHAKASYQPTGRECSDQEMSQLVASVEAAADSALRWLSETHLEVNKLLR